MLIPTAKIIFLVWSFYNNSYSPYFLSVHFNSSIWTSYKPNSNSRYWESGLTVRGRHLLSLTENSTSGGISLTEYIEKDPETQWVNAGDQAQRVLQFDRDLQRLLSTGMLNESTVAAHFCPIYFNSTESSRLVSLYYCYFCTSDLIYFVRMLRSWILYLSSH